MVNGSLVLLILVVVWSAGFAVLLGRDCRTVDPERGKEDLDGMILALLRRPGPEKRGAEERIIPLVLMLKLGELLLAAILLRTSLAPDPTGLALLVIAVGLAAYMLRHYRPPRYGKGANWYNLYPLATDYGVLEVTLTPGGVGGEWIGSTLAELNLRKKDLLVLAIIREEKVIIFPKGPEFLSSGDRLLLFGKYIPILVGSE